MPVIPLGSTPHGNAPTKSIVPFALGFRPFFLLAGLAGVLLLALWLLLWTGLSMPLPYYGLTGWHSHEMLFGYATAVIAGFLLTAVRNWTGIATPTGLPLAGLALLWLAGRLLPFAQPPVPGAVLAVTDLLFLPLLALALARPLWQGQNHVNRLFLPLLAAMALANALIHGQALGLPGSAGRGTTLMLELVLLLIAFVGGRVMPFFTEKAVPGARAKQDPRLERIAFAALLLLIALDLVLPDAHWAVALGAALVALTQGLRMFGWYRRGIWRIPILWVLYSGFGWLVTGFALKALAAAGLFPPTLATHALTVGAIGVLTLGMMARVALGHTGRELRSAAWITLAFALLNLGAATRVFLPLALPDLYRRWVETAGALWIAAFLLFCLYYLPILLRPRVDGRPG